MGKKLTKEYYLKGWRTIVRYLKPHRREVVILAVLSMVAAVGSGVTPYLAGKLFDGILGKLGAVRIGQWSVSPFVVLIGAWLMARLTTDIAERFKGVRQERLTATLEADYLVSGFSKLLRLPVGFHKAHKIGETTERIRRASGWLEAIVNRMMINLAPEFFSILVAIAITFAIKPLLAGLLVTAVAIYSGLLFRIAPALSERARAMHRTYSAAYGDAHDTVMNFQAVKQATAERFEQHKLFRNFHLR
ncbi:ABC transporter ATP-binding protein, partial [Candidatus Parcubacteria bacterium]|nr:ABC transporter ATP-binding protein [Candidatus Parcubacteria bacterium]